MKKILITGASGFVGSHLVEESLRRDLEVFAGVRASSSRDFLRDERIRFVELNFADTAQLANAVKTHRFDYIIHNAGIVSAPRPEDYWKVNCEYVKNFANAILAAGHQPEKFTFISTAASYGPASPDDLTDFITEDREPRPINTYGKAKLEAERFLTQLHDFPYVILRPTGVYGPREREIFTFFQFINRNIEAYIGFRRQHLALVYIKDLVRVALDATTTAAVTQKSYFVSDGRYYAQRDLGAAARKILRKRTLRFHIPATLIRSVAWLMEQLYKNSGSYPALNLEKVRILESINWKCDIEPLREDLNFQPQYDLEEGLAETLAWYKENGWL
ncbi:MAG: hypothetical protein RI973_228 [Bacteroidota bacterium]|jgi:nucleoside-diphosphate-sugar epimerase